MKHEIIMQIPVDSVAYRWFYISNWSTLQHVKRVDLESSLQSWIDNYASKFREKAYFEVIDGSTIYRVDANTFEKETTNV